MLSSRRRFLHATVAAGLGGLAGCSVLDEASDDDSSDDSRDAPSTPEAAARAFVDRLFAGDYRAAEDMLAGVASQQVSPARIERVRLGLEAAAGEFQSIEGVTVGSVSGFDAVDLALSLSGGRAPLRVVVDADTALRGVVIDGAYEPASYVDESAFEATDHALAVDGCELGATLTTPAGVDSAPGAVIVHGSGPMDRDGSTGANRPYRDIAEGLATRGVAVLRYQKRTDACNVPAAERTIDRVTTDDALAAVEWLRDREGVAAGAVTVIGHSLGAMMAPEIARRDGDIARIVGLATPARSLDDLILDQLDYLANVGELTIDPVEQRREEWVDVAERVRAGDYADDELLLDLPGAFWRSLADYDQVAVASDLSVPQAYSQGGRDYQVTTGADFTVWESTLGDDDSVALTEYPDLDHLFLRTYGPSVPEAYGVPRQVAEPVVADLADRLAG